MKWARRARGYVTAVVVWFLISPGSAEGRILTVGDGEQMVAFGGAYGDVFRFVTRKPETPATETDMAYLRNGDKVSGRIEGIRDGVVLLRSELLPKVMKIPVGNVGKLLFKDRRGGGPERDARAMLLNGDHVSVSFKGYEGGEVAAGTDFSEEARIKREHLAGVVFRREPRVIYRAEFGEVENGDACGFKSLGGEWGVTKGKFGPLQDSWSGASLKLHQEGRVRYTWKVRAEEGYSISARFYFLARVQDHNAPGDAYQVRMSGRAIYLYRSVQNNIQHVARFTLPSNKSSLMCEVDYDSGSGSMQVKVDGKEVIAGVFTSPIVQGEYIILAGSGRNGFENMVVEQVADGVLPRVGEENGGKDCVFLANGDRLSGVVMDISDKKVRVETGYCGEALEVPVEEVSAVRFGGGSAKGGEELPVISLRNGDRLSAEVICIEESSLRLRSPYLGDIGVDVDGVASVVFPGEEGFFDAARGIRGPGSGAWGPARGPRPLAPTGQVYGSFQELPLNEERNRDEIVLRNGDRLSGEVLEIGGDILHFAAGMAEGNLEVPLRSLKRVLFKKETEGEESGSDEIALVGGGRFGAIVEGTEGEKLIFRAISSENPSREVLALDKVASVGFGGEPLVLLNADFTDGASSPFETNEGEWLVYKGQLWQSDPSHRRARACARVKQWGRMRYSWTMHTTDWGNAGVYILASDRSVDDGSNSLRIHLNHGQLTLYKAEGHGENQVFYRQVGSGMAKGRFETEYDCKTGEIRITLNGRPVAHLKDAGSPLESGEYVVLLAMGRASFDDVRVEHLGGGPESTEGEDGNDVVVLKNGDRIVGDVKSFSEEKIAVTPQLAEEELAVEREKVLRIVFARRPDRSPPTREPQAGIVFWDGNRLEGKVESLRDDVVAIKNEAVGMLRFDAACVKSIIFAD